MSRGNQLKRQWRLLQVLQSYKYGVDIKELVARAECCRRTVERDLGILQEVGFPISYELKDSSRKYWKLEQKFLESDKFIVEPTELMGLYLIRQSLAKANAGPLGEGLEKLCRKIEPRLPKKALSYFSDLEEKIYIKNTAASNISSIQQSFIHLIDQAIDACTILKIAYQTAGKSVSIAFHPYGMTILNNSIYILGYAEHAKDVRTLKLQRIENVEQTNKKFRKPEDFSMSKFLGGSFGIVYDENPSTTIRCRMQSWAAQIVREQKFHKTQTIEEDDGKELLVSFLLDSTTEFKQWILGFGPLAQVIEPAFLKNDIAALLKETLQQYK